MVNVDPDAEEPCNRTVTVYGRGGTVPAGGTAQQPLELFVGNAGTAARFLAAFVCLGRGVYRLHGVARMHERPQAALFQALRQLGYRIESPNSKLPALIYGAGPRPGNCSVSIAESSQFASALLLCAGVGGWRIEITGENAEESPYVAMTKQLIGAFPKAGGIFPIEPDASSGSYFLASASFEVQPATGRPAEVDVSSGTVRPQQPRLKPTVVVRNWPRSGWQIDGNFPKFAALHALTHDEKAGTLSISRATDLGDSIMTAITLAPLLRFPVRFTELGRLRVQECERVSALRTELTRCGAKVLEEGDTLTVFPSRLHGAEIETYQDHRMAMCFAILGLKVAGMRLKNPSCVKKTFPNFFQKLAAPPPKGLGAVIRDGPTGRVLTASELFAE
jgi:3-phosphoshikimate 1-carboxyvinyltransferase